jgi:hypothetical protein
LNNNNRPKPTLEKFNLTDEEKQDIKDTMDGKPTKALIEKWYKRGWSPVNKKNYNAGSIEGRIKSIRKKYFKSGICKCGNFPDFKLIYKLDGASLREYYCDECFDKVV